MAKFSRFDPRNKKNNRNKKLSQSESHKKSKSVDDKNEQKYISKYKKIQYHDDDPALNDEADEELGWDAR
jgi:hypothetical protein